MPHERDLHERRPLATEFEEDALDAEQAWPHLDMMVFELFASERHVWEVKNPNVVRRSGWITGNQGSHWTSRSLALLERAVSTASWTQTSVWCRLARQPRGA